MKYIKFLFVIMLGLLFIPFGVFAEENTDDNKKINIYFFHGNGCPHCEEAKKFFDNIDEDYKKYYNLIDYEVWYNEENAELMQKVADNLGQEVTGVPYLIIGKKTWSGYSTDYDEEIKQTIKEEYEKAVDSRYDVMDYVTSEKNDDSVGSDIFALILILLAVGGIVGGIIYARKKV